MTKKLGVYKCSACGQTLEVVEMGNSQLNCSGSSYALTCSKANAQVACCGNPMEFLAPNTIDAPTEKA
jgi:desulfoferrodoxin-like iron-binding protein